MHLATKIGLNHGIDRNTFWSPFLRICRKLIRPFMRFGALLRLSVWRAFEHDAFAIAKASAFSSILTFFPLLVVLGSILATSNKFDVYIGELSDALGRILPAGSGTAIEYLRGRKRSTCKVSGYHFDFDRLDGFRCRDLVDGRVSQSLQAAEDMGAGKRASDCELSRNSGGNSAHICNGTRCIWDSDRSPGRFPCWHELGPLLWLAGTALRWTVAAGTSIAVIALIYHNAVPRTQAWHTVLPGAALATGMWFGSSLLFGWYISRYADYSIIYGSLGVGIALLVWMYLVSLVLLVGSEFNAILSPRCVSRRSVSFEISHGTKTPQLGDAA